jgi:hypothetical protein
MEIIILQVTTTLKAMATAPGMANRTVTSGLCTIH